MSSQADAAERAASAEGEVHASSRASYNTIKRSPKRKRAYFSRLAFAFALVAIMTVAVLVLVLAVVWEGQFQDYTRENMQMVAQSTAARLSEAYEQAGGWNAEMLDEASAASSISPDIAVQVISSEGEVLYDDTFSRRNRGEDGVQVPPPKSEELAPADVVPRGLDSSVSADVVDSSGNVVGMVRVWAFGTDALLTKNDAAFRINSYGAIGVAAIIALGLSVLVALFMSRALAKPLRRITSTAAQIRNGDLTARTGLQGGDEIGRLGETFDDMATTIEKDLDREHRLTSDVAHELRTPLMALQANIEAMQDGVLPADDEHFETIGSEVRRLSRLVDAMLHLSRVENGAVELKVERTDIVSLVRGLVNAQHQLFHDKGLHLRFDDKTNHGECWAEVDPDLIREAVTNLMSNSMRYTNEGGWIVLSVAHIKGEAIITVSDTGIGIAKEDIPRTFSRFWRSDASRERVSGGLGVGLALTKEIIDRHNGVIAVDSELGNGTTFTLRLPTHRGGTLLPVGLAER